MYQNQHPVEKCWFNIVLLHQTSMFWLFFIQISFAGPHTEHQWSCSKKVVDHRGERRHWKRDQSNSQFCDNTKLCFFWRWASDANPWCNVSISTWIIPRPCKQNLPPQGSFDLIQCLHCKPQNATVFGTDFCTTVFVRISMPSPSCPTSSIPRQDSKSPCTLPLKTPLHFRFSLPHFVSHSCGRKNKTLTKKQRKKAQIVVMMNKTFTVSRQCFGVHTVGKKKKRQQQQKERET